MPGAPAVLPPQGRMTVPFKKLTSFSGVGEGAKGSTWLHRLGPIKGLGVR